MALVGVSVEGWLGGEARPIGRKHTKQTWVEGFFYVCRAVVTSEYTAVEDEAAHDESEGRGRSAHAIWIGAIASVACGSRWTTWTGPDRHCDTDS